MSIEPITIIAPKGDNPSESKLYYGHDCREILRQLPDQSVHMIATSPPYWGLRDYGNDPSLWGGGADCDHQWEDQGSERGSKSALCSTCGAWLGQLGLEPNPYMFIDHLVEIFREAKRVLRDDGTLWVNLGDSYANPGIQKSALSSTGGFTGKRVRDGKKGTMNSVLRAIPEGIKYKDLIGVPWRVAFALQADGWYLRADIIWAKGNPMPESVTDRPTKAHEYVFLMTKNEKYFYDIDAIKEPLTYPTAKETYGSKHQHAQNNQYSHSGRDYDGSKLGGRNKRSVWNVNTKPYKGAHFATWPEDLVKPMVLAGCPEGGVVLDPFSGSATTGKVANDLGRNYIGIDRNPNYVDLAKHRLLGLPAPTEDHANDSNAVLDLFG